MNFFARNLVNGYEQFEEVKLKLLYENHNQLTQYIVDAAIFE